MNVDLKIIKKKYGEEMMRFCRTAFSNILEEEGKLSELLLAHFESSHFLYNDILQNNSLLNFKNYINGLISTSFEVVKTDKTPFELLDEAGYILYECKNERDIQKFKKYYAKGEELCTFYGGRLNYCHVFFAVKKNIDEIKREDFENPKRQDAYGTSIISIQYTKDENNYLSIKNRYNHRVFNPDATYSNNLDNIISGLTYSFEKYYGLVQKNKNNYFELPNYIHAADGKYYKYNYEIDNIYYCTNNVIIENFEPKKYPKEKYLIFDYFILDLQNKTIDTKLKWTDDAFIHGLKDIKNIKIKNNNSSKTIYITPNIGEIIEIELDKENALIGYKNNNLISDGGHFLYYNKKLKWIQCDNLKTMNYYFLVSNLELEEISFPNLIEMEMACLKDNKKIKSVICPNLEIIGDDCLYSNKELLEIDLPNVKKIKSLFLIHNNKIKIVNLPKLEEIGRWFLSENDTLEKISLPNVKYIKRGFLEYNNKLIILNMPELIEVEENFLTYNTTLKDVNLPKLIEYGYSSLNIHPTIKLQKIVEENKKRTIVRKR